MTGKIGYWRDRKRGPHTVEWNEKIRKKMTGNGYGFKKGHEQSPETIEKRASKLRGKKQPPRSKIWCDNIKKGKMGKKYPNRKSPPPFTEERRKRLRESHLGKKCIFWKGGISTENQKIRHSIYFRLWRESVFVRDNWTCQKCKIKSGIGYSIYLHPHHIYNFSEYFLLRFDVNNGITFCYNCHKEFHHIYGTKNNNQEQIKEFIK